MYVNPIRNEYAYVDIGISFKVNRPKNHSQLDYTQFQMA